MERRPHGAATQAGSELFRMAWEMAWDAMALSDPDGIVLAVNHAYLRLYGFSAEQVVGHSFAIIFPESVRAWAVEQYQIYFNAGDPPAPVESTIQRADGTVRVVESSVGFVTEDGRRTAMLSIIRDITDRKRLDDGLRAAQQDAEESAARLAQLQAVTEAFSKALTPPEVTRIILEQGLPAIGAAAGVVMLLSEDAAELVMTAQQGHDQAAMASWPRIALAAPLPMAEVVGTREPLFFASREALHERFAPTNLEPPEHVAWAVLPLAVDDRALGALGVSFAAPHAFSPGERGFLMTLARQCAQALDRSRLFALEQSERTRLEARVSARTVELTAAKQALEAEIAGRHQVEQELEQSREAERARLARELHDGLGGALTGLKMDLARLRRHLPPNQPETEARLADMLALVDETVVIMRRIAADLRPAVLDDLGLADAVAWQVDEFRRRSGLDCRLVTNADTLDLDPKQAIAVYRIVQEALTNVARHAAATAVEVRLDRDNDRLRLLVRDDGQGMAHAQLATRTTMGLAGMRERVRLLGGALSIDSAEGQGTTVRVELPTRP